MGAWPARSNLYSLLETRQANNRLPQLTQLNCSFLQTQFLPSRVRNDKVTLHRGSRGHGLQIPGRAVFVNGPEQNAASRCPHASESAQESRTRQLLFHSAAYVTPLSSALTPSVLEARRGDRALAVTEGLYRTHLRGTGTTGLAQHSLGEI